MDREAHATSGEGLGELRWEWCAGVGWMQIVTLAAARQCAGVGWMQIVTLAAARRCAGVGWMQIVTLAAARQCPACNAAAT